MFKTVSFLLVLIASVALAEPTLAQVKQAVSANPALLQTPQAKAMMKEKGVSMSEVKKKLSENSHTDVKETKTSDATNDIAETSDKTSDAVEKEQSAAKYKKVYRRVNPFRYQTDEEIKQELNIKKQRVSNTKLHRYSISFYKNKNKLDSSSLPTPDDYIMSEGDHIGIHVYGDRDETYSLVVKNDGTVDLAFIGPLKVGGMEFAAAKKHLIQQLKNHFKMSDFNVNIDKYSTIQVTLVGDVLYPGLYNLASFSTIKDLLIVAKGVRKSASVRNIIVKRNSKVIATLDFYDLLFKGKPFGNVLLKHGDIVLIKQAKKLVSIDGYVDHAAKFELLENETLQKLIEYAGGLKPDASKDEIKIRRFDNNQKIKTYSVRYKDSKNFKMKDGDSVYVYPLDFTAKNSINIYGNIIRPGTYSLNDVKTLHALFKESLKDGLQRFFLPNTYFEYGVIKRYTKKLQYTTQSFHLENVINGTEDVNLYPKDEVYIFGLNDIYSNAYVLTKGSVLIKPGKLQYVNGITIKDVINAAGINGVIDDKIRVTTYATEDFMPQTTFYSLKIQGDTVLNPYDEIEVYDYYSSHILEPVTIKGEVVKPTSTYYEKGMSVANLIDIAGGFNKKAYTKSLSILRYYIDATQTRQQKVLSFDLNKSDISKIILEPYDEVRISKILGWDSQDYETVSIAGEIHKAVKIKYGTGLSLEDLIIAAGGLTKKAYLNKLEIVRYYINEAQERTKKIINIDFSKLDLQSYKLEPYDEVTIYKIPHWNERKSVVLKGEVRFPGVYTISSNEKLSSVIQRAGGYTKEAFVEGAVFTRENIKKRQIKEYNRSLAKIKRELALYNAMPANAKKVASSGNTNATLNEVMLEAKKYQPIGRVSVTLEKDIKAFRDSKFDLVLKNSDTLFVPSQIDTITVFGEVFNPTSFVFDAVKNADDYIAMASGLSRSADGSHIYVVHANGISEPISKSWFSSSIEIQKGDTIVVPLYIKETNNLDLWDSVSRILASFAITAATMNTLGIF